MAAANCRMLHVPETRRYSPSSSSGDRPSLRFQHYEVLAPACRILFA